MEMKKAEITNNHGYTKEDIKKLKTKYQDVRKADTKMSVVMLCMDGYGVNQIVKLLNLDNRTVSKYIKKFNDGGLELLLQYKTSPGRRSRMSEQETELVESALESSPKEMGCGNSENWTMKDIQVFVKNEFNKDYTTTGLRKKMMKRGYAFNRPTYVLAKASKKNR